MGTARMKRTRIDPEMIASHDVLVAAATRAAAGKRARPDVRRFFNELEANIATLRRDLLAGVAPYNRYHTFTIFDPKQRLITAVCFADRIAHHALIACVEPVLERALVPDSYACRPGKGPLAAVLRAHGNIRRYGWYVKIDVNRYFETVDHGVLLALLRRKLKGAFLDGLIERIVEGYSTAEGKGLPIGSLTSQHFANYYLDGLDRMIMASRGVHAYVRYMDDMIWWCSDKRSAKRSLETARAYARDERLLVVKDNVQVQRSSKGVTFCGFRILPGDLRLTQRKKQRYTRRRRYWEDLHAAGEIDGRRLQGAYDSVRGVVSHAVAGQWLRQQLSRYPSPDV